ncbi:MAG: 30S ribosomal protein S15 [Candidatus Aenigmarchaeota archaeon]|nr:30S ribosomal protein S15 [Candidatus Aenigmarchaeota archaeon]
MARMYSRKKGKSGSHRPANADVKWVTHKPEEVEAIAVRLGKEGKTQAEIGTILRDQYGIPSVRAVTKKKMGSILREKGIKNELPEEMLNLLKNAVKLRSHLDNNKHDRYSKRGLELTESKIRRLAKYYKSRNVIPESWKYDLEKAKLLVK